MQFIPCKIPDVILVEPDVYRDERGFFIESYQRKRYAEGGIDVDFVQDNHSLSRAGTLRGLHAQLVRPQGKLLRTVAGEIFDVAVDVRVGSGTFGQWVGELLSSENFRQLYVPPGFVHGFYVLSPVAEVEYKCTDYYERSGEIGVRWNDPEIGIDWPLLGEPILSDKDREAPFLHEIIRRLEGVF